MYLVHLIAMGLVGGAPTPSNQPDAIPLISAGLPSDTPSTAYQPTAYADPAQAYVYSPAPVGSWYVRAAAEFVTGRTENGPDSTEDVDFDDGVGASVGVGQRVGAWNTGLGFSVELDVFYANQDADKANAAVSGQDVLAGMIDGILDFRIYDRFSIYGGAGLGLAWQDVDTQSGFQDEDGPFFAWTAKAGGAWHFNSVTSLYLGYRFVHLDDNEIDSSTETFNLETNMHCIEAGLMFGI